MAAAIRDTRLDCFYVEKQHGEAVPSVVSDLDEELYTSGSAHDHGDGSHGSARPWWR